VRKKKSSYWEVELSDHAKNSQKQSPSLKARALRLLSMREYSRKGLEAKLNESAQRMRRNDPALDKPHDPQSAAVLSLQITAVLDDFEARGWLSDQRFAEALVRRRSERFGARKIQDELERAGVDSHQSAQLIGALKETEFQRAYELWMRKFGEVAQEQKERARQYRFLASKGFSSEVVSKVVAGRSA
jgi:regulatory protein